MMNFVISTGHLALQCKLIQLRWAEHVAGGKKEYVQYFDVKCLWIKVHTECNEGERGVILKLILHKYSMFC